MPPRKRRELEHEKLLRDAHKDGTYELLLQQQEGRCGICRKPPHDDRRLDIDHDHKTMVIRGLLCRGCNMRLRRGMTSSWLRGAARYLDRVPQ